MSYLVILLFCPCIVISVYNYVVILIMCISYKCYIVATRKFS